MEDVFSSKGLPLRNRVEKWESVTGKDSKVGDSISGKFLGWFENPAKDDGYKNQIVFVLEVTKNDKVEVIAVPVKDNALADGSRPNKQRAEQCQVGDSIGIRFDGEKDTGKPQPYKIVNIYNPSLEQRQQEGKTVITQAAESAPVVEDADQFNDVSTMSKNDLEPNPEDTPF